MDSYMMEIIYFLIMLLLAPMIVFAAIETYKEMKEPMHRHRDWIIWGLVATTVWGILLFVIMKIGGCV